MNARELLRGLGRNLWAGLRLALLPGVRWSGFRATPGDYATLVAFNLVAWFTSATLRASGEVQLDSAAFAVYLGTVPLVLGCGYLVAHAYGQPRSGLLVAVALSASDAIVEVAGLAFGALPLSGGMRTAGFALFFLWVWAIAMRAVAVCTGARGRGLVRGALIVTCLGAFMTFVYPRSDPWLAAPGEAQAPPALADEKLFHAQGEVVAGALQAIAPGHDGVPEAYFVGFAPDGSDDAFLHEARAAKERFEASFGAAGRSIALVSNEASLRELPLATVTNLRRALGRVAERMNADEDVLFLYVAARGDRRFDLSAWMPPLVQPPVNPTVLARLLQDTGIRWRVVVVSACYAGGFIEPLKDPYTLVIAAAASDRASFDCEGGPELTPFGEALRDGLGGEGDLFAAFERAKARIAAREAAEGKPPSSPQLWAGDRIAAKLAALGARR